MCRTAPLILLSGLLLVPIATRAEDRALEARIAAYAEPLAKSEFLSGCLWITRGGDLVANACWGYVDAERVVPADIGKRFCIASLTKPMTTVAVLALADQNKLSLDDTVDRWIDDFPSGDSISVRDLLTHTAGVPHRVTTPEEEVQRFTPADIVERIKEQGLLFPPHTKSQYSSAGYTVLAYIIERITGMNYGDAMMELVFTPLDMHHTYHPDGRKIPHRATSFVAGADGPVEAPEKDYAFLAGAGSIYCTPEDVAFFANAYLDRALLSEEGWNAFHSLGWARGEVVRWGGSTNGWGSWLDIYKEDGTVFVFLGNAGTGACNILRSALPALVAGEEAPPPPQAPKRVKLSEEQMRGIEGGYARSGSKPTLMVVVEDGVVHMGDNVVYAIAVDRFFNPTYFSEAQFERGDNGVATTIKMTAPGLTRPLVFNRVSQ